MVTYPKKGFNFSGINNFGRKYATGEYLLLLNNCLLYTSRCV